MDYYEGTSDIKASIQQGSIGVKLWMLKRFFQGQPYFQGAVIFLRMTRAPYARLCRGQAPG